MNLKAGENRAVAVDREKKKRYIPTKPFAVAITFYCATTKPTDQPGNIRSVLIRSPRSRTRQDRPNSKNWETEKEKREGKKKVVLQLSTQEKDF